MWIKTPAGNLINTDNVIAIQTEPCYGADGNKFWLTVEDFRIEAFRDEEKAKEYLAKLAEKLGAEEI